MRRLALLVLAGCSASSNIQPNPECPGGMCAVSDAILLAAEVLPLSTNANAAAAPPTQEIAHISIDASNHFTLTLERANTLDGTVVDPSTMTPVPAGIVLVRPSRIPGRPAVFYQTRANDKGAWSVVVSPTHDGEIYTLRVQPDDSAHRPPETFLIDGARDRTVALALSDPKALLQIHGTVTNALQQPVVGMQVQAQDPETHAGMSTVAVTDAQGNFAVRLAPPPTALLGSSSPPMGSTMVMLVATSAPMGPWLPRLELPVDVTRGGPANSLTVNLVLPPLPNAAQLVYSVVGLGPSGKEVQVAGAHCQFSAEVSDPKSEVRAYYEVAADTDAAGKASVMLIPAADTNRDYQVAVSPPSSSEFQATSTTVPVGPAGGYGAAIQLPLRAQVTGTVLAPDGTPVKGLTVLPMPATLASVLAPSQTALVSNLSTAQTDSTGGFVLRVDNGSYDFGLIPPAISKLPRQWLSGQAVSSDVELAPVMLPPASPVTGEVDDALRTPLAGADVRLYLLPPQNFDCAAQDYGCLSPPKLIAEGTVAADGSLSVLLPGSSR